MPHRVELAHLRRREAQACELGHDATDTTVKANHFKMAESLAAQIAVLKRKSAAG